MTLMASHWDMALNRANTSQLTDAVGHMVDPYTLAPVERGVRWVESAIRSGRFYLLPVPNPIPATVNATEAAVMREVLRLNGVKEATAEPDKTEPEKPEPGKPVKADPPTSTTSKTPAAQTPTSTTDTEPAAPSASK